jgi:hypothetical protein
MMLDMRCSSISSSGRRGRDRIGSTAARRANLVSHLDGGGTTYDELYLGAEDDENVG